MKLKVQKYHKRIAVVDPRYNRAIWSISVHRAKYDSPSWKAFWMLAKVIAERGRTETLWEATPQELTTVLERIRDELKLDGRYSISRLLRYLRENFHPFFGVPRVLYEYPNDAEYLFVTPYEGVYGNIIGDLILYWNDEVSITWHNLRYDPRKYELIIDSNTYFHDILDDTSFLTGRSLLTRVFQALPHYDVEDSDGYIDEIHLCLHRPLHEFPTEEEYFSTKGKS